MLTHNNIFIKTLSYLDSRTYYMHTTWVLHAHHLPAIGFSVGNHLRNILVLTRLCSHMTIFSVRHSSRFRKWTHASCLHPSVWWFLQRRPHIHCTENSYWIRFIHIWRRSCRVLSRKWRTYPKKKNIDDFVNVTSPGGGG